MLRHVCGYIIYTHRYTHTHIYIDVCTYMLVMVCAWVMHAWELKGLGGRLCTSKVGRLCTLDVGRLCTLFLCDFVIVSL